MASEAEKKEFSKRKSIPVPPVTVPSFPKFSENIPIRRPADMEKWKKMDDLMEQWRRSLIERMQ